MSITPKRSYGFTLAELLVALLILGEIATFTIPKILSSQQNGTFKARSKEAASMLSAAYSQHTLSNGFSASGKTSDLSQYMNYVQYVTSGLTIDRDNGEGSIDCDSSNPCLKLHSGAVLLLTPHTFNGTGANNAVWALLDPDGVYSGTTNGTGKSVEFDIYYNGRLTTWGTCNNPTCGSEGCWGTDANKDPSWFSW